MAESNIHITDSKPVLAPRQSSINLIDRGLSLLSSVKLGITIMIVLILFSILGTIIMQYNIDGFEKYYAALTPSEQQLYRWFGFFDLYHTNWFTALLILFSLNLVLVSIDIFPKAWKFVAEPVLRVTPPFIRSQPVHRSFRLTSEEGVLDRVTEMIRSSRYRVNVTSDESNVTVFGQKGVWNRFVVLVIHVAVLLILGAAFVGNNWGYEGVMPLAPGEKANAIHVAGSEILGMPNRSQALPFQLDCSNIRVDLKDPDGPLQQGNYRNWYTDVTMVDGDKKESATIWLNHPYDYAGYRFFQASFSPNGGESSDITVDLKSPDGSARSLKLERNKPVNVEGLGQVKFIKFTANVLDERPEAQDYSRPVAQLEITKPNGETTHTAAFLPQMAEMIKSQSAMAEMAGRLDVDGHSFTLKEISRTPLFHVIQVQYDPGVDYTYLGYLLLCVTLVAVFSFSHERIWASVERTKDNETYLHLGGHSSRNPLGLEKKFEALVERLKAMGIEELPEKAGTTENTPADALT